jgi:hypothetical protein
VGAEKKKKKKEKRKKENTYSVIGLFTFRYRKIQRDVSWK